MEITIKQSDWTGKESKITINKKEKTFTMPDGNRFKIIKSKGGMKVISDDGQWDREDEFCSIFEGLSGDGQYTAYVHRLDLERSSDSIYTAAAQILFNIL